MSDYVSRHVFDGARPLTPQRRQQLMNKFLTDNQIIQGLLEHAPAAGDSSYVIKSAANLLDRLRAENAELRSENIKLTTQVQDAENDLHNARAILAKHKPEP